MRINDTDQLSASLRRGAVLGHSESADGFGSAILEPSHLTEEFAVPWRECRKRPSSFRQMTSALQTAFARPAHLPETISKCSSEAGERVIAAHN